VIISIGRTYRVNWHGEENAVEVKVGDVAHNTSENVTGFLCHDVDDPHKWQVVYPQDFIAETI
jgi:hypothetical protein